MATTATASLESATNWHDLLVHIPDLGNPALRISGAPRELFQHGA